MSSVDEETSEIYELNHVGRVGSNDDHLNLPSHTKDYLGDNDLDQEALLSGAGSTDIRWREPVSTVPRWAVGSILNVVNDKASTRTLSFQPLCPHFQATPSKLVSKCLPGAYGDILVTLLVVIVWAIAFGLITKTYQLDNQADDFGEIARLSCSSRLWPNSTYCGLNGARCGPFDSSSFAFRCPASCANEKILEPHVIGDQEINYQHYVIGGPSGMDDRAESVYRGDSFICPAAIHANIVTDRSGGCGVIRRVGEQGNFSSTNLHGINSVGFEPRFPLAYTLEPGSEICRDPQWILLFVSIVASCLISIFVNSSGIFFSAIFCIVHFQVALASEAPYFSDYSSVVSAAFGRLLPSGGIGFAIYHLCVRRCLGGLKAPLERTFLWVGTCWVGALNKYTFDQLPISRLTPHDIQQQPGALTALVIIVVTVVVIALGQAWAFRREGRLSNYVLLYLILGLLLVSLTQIPGLDLRIHHYIIALLLLPGTSLQTRPSWAYQGVLVGLFVNGIARWDFASVLQTPAELLQDGLLGSAVPQMTLSFASASSIIFAIDKMAEGFDGISLLINDVERFQESSVAVPIIVNWTRQHTDEPVFIRFAFTARKVLGGFWYGDFTEPGVWWQNGTWTG